MTEPTVRQSRVTNLKRLTDTELKRWEMWRERGYAKFRRHFFWIVVAVCAAAAAVIAVLLMLNLIPAEMRMVAITTLMLMPLTPFLMTLLFTPLIWRTNELQYQVTIQERDTKTDSDSSNQSEHSNSSN